MNLEQQLDSEWQLASPETPPSTHASSFAGSLRLPYPLRLEEENEEVPLERGITTCLGVEGSCLAAYSASASGKSLLDACGGSVDHRASEEEEALQEEPD
jgi:hypothetical protein